MAAKNLIHWLFLGYIILGQAQERDKYRKALKSQKGRNLPCQPVEVAWVWDWGSTCITEDTCFSALSLMLDTGRMPSVPKPLCWPSPLSPISLTSHMINAGLAPGLPRWSLHFGSDIIICVLFSAFCLNKVNSSKEKYSYRLGREKRRFDPPATIGFGRLSMVGKAGPRLPDSLFSASPPFTLPWASFVPFDTQERVVSTQQRFEPRP